MRHQLPALRNSPLAPHLGPPHKCAMQYAFHPGIYIYTSFGHILSVYAISLCLFPIRASHRTGRPAHVCVQPQVILVNIIQSPRASGMEPMVHLTQHAGAYAKQHVAKGRFG